MDIRSAFLIAVVALPAAAILPAGTVAVAQDAQAEMQAFTDAHHKMLSAMESMKPTGDADKDFVMMMIPHHQGAIDMAQVELQYGKDPVLREMAEQIIKAQQEEIAKMQTWQKENGM
jgi:uncharacterized protein (DUF305 family)